MTSSGIRRSAFLSPFLTIFLALPGRAENSFTIPDIALFQGAAGQEIPVLGTNDVPVLAMSFSIRFDPAALQVAKFSNTGAATEGAEYWQGTIDGEEGTIVYGCILDLSIPDISPLPPGSYALARIVAGVRAAPGVRAGLEFVDGLGSSPGSYPVNNIMTDINGLKVIPVLRSGSVTALPVDAFSAEASEVELDGSEAVSDPGAILQVSWSQISGAPAQLVSGGDTLHPRYLLPAVTADETLLFQVSVFDGMSVATDQEAVMAVDLDVREAAAAVPKGTEPSLIDGGQAIVFEGEIAWGTAPPEDAAPAALDGPARLHRAPPRAEERLAKGRRIQLRRGSLRGKIPWRRDLGRLRLDDLLRLTCDDRGGYHGDGGNVRWGDSLRGRLLGEARSQ